ncbi:MULTISPECIES: magnesium/cobalt transporter CorA [unclassified Campylobacter]|uniref:magnesium/cobalt transporter CorA n=1 Tax=unclassified Campylobacter TaxID=2593542 RepID=UPI00123823FB|nr:MULTISPECIES: magnesium/cobalt transporter CorA [unclassified Campylobacter]KAA6226438.1 magnesium/cobalt transporter CorA [Campylobacter sp. LR286c]KAA6226524.1 magnesium/cobalt transporter CorA [Campylobacter sp. LR185c]KAA6226926.1 magnesium/cobalt transporter CorA [Campylobacter sp. LR196d]KAA6233670.1 magnesium/cobalt transporter CorA [Campylobacter sp. LR291e]KAA6233890.1 magnesium/cobalt transporter CorA [Campylobacter sp. LR264d]
MLYIYIKTQDALVKRIEFKPEGSLPPDILWIDLLHPSTDEIIYISSKFKLKFPNKEEREEIEQSSKYWEDNINITINANFLVRDFSSDEDNFRLKSEVITFATAKKVLFTIRYNEFSTFEEIQARILASPKNFEDGYDIIDKMFEVRVEKDADLLEWIDKEARRLRANVLKKKDEYSYDEMLKDISSLQELNMRIRDSLFDKRRAMTSLLKSDKIDKDIKQNLTIVLKDLNSLVEFGISQLNVLDNIQTILANQINIEQNKTIKLFTVATVAMMPPTLIGTVYGMNFEFMPELDMPYAYPIVLSIMIISIIAPVIFFKKKGWL